MDAATADHVKCVVCDAEIDLAKHAGYSTYTSLVGELGRYPTGVLFADGRALCFPCYTDGRVWAARQARAARLRAEAAKLVDADVWVQDY